MRSFQNFPPKDYCMRSERTIQALTRFSCSQLVTLSWGIDNSPILMDCHFDIKPPAWRS